MKDVMERALTVHATIKARLAAASRTPGTMSATEVLSDRTCEFGTWLYGPGQAFAGTVEFDLLKTTHRRFHKAAAAALCECEAGRREAAEHSITAGEFDACSSEMKQRLMAMKSVLRAEAVD